MQHHYAIPDRATDLEDALPLVTKYLQDAANMPCLFGEAKPEYDIQKVTFVQGHDNSGPCRGMYGEYIPLEHPDMLEMIKIRLLHRMAARIVVQWVVQGCPLTFTIRFAAFFKLEDAKGRVNIHTIMDL